MARYADPYDRDFPPAPPDDYATQALSPVPQWSYNRLIVPVEGTGYLAMLQEFQSEHPTAPARATSPETAGPDPFAGEEVPSPADPRPRRPFVPPGGDINADPLQTPAIPGDPGPREMQDLSRPPVRSGPAPTPPRPSLPAPGRRRQPGPGRRPGPPGTPPGRRRRRTAPTPGHPPRRFSGRPRAN